MQAKWEEWLIGLQMKPIELTINSKKNITVPAYQSVPDDNSSIIIDNDK